MNGLLLFVPWLLYFISGKIDLISINAKHFSTFIRIYEELEEKGGKSAESSFSYLSLLS